ncbi:MAG: hypothetical protein LBK47_06405 [Prevotellaceae bacterium]|nr:hypothetical protein [Prevotellaceae bacterium]
MKGAARGAVAFTGRGPSTRFLVPRALGRNDSAVVVEEEGLGGGYAAAPSFRSPLDFARGRLRAAEWRSLLPGALVVMREPDKLKSFGQLTCSHGLCRASGAGRVG